ncbi:MAG TPA: LacI family DNA-binding transcriptional regulator [Beijerinckiaceae bacterium]|jgi:LacI family transcriptional regulator|nr:LacI family DNA-binding transcriptional regulator [Beijerinckiaceae bacterium]
MLKRRRATLKDVAESVGVHVSTVSRALNPETRHLITSDIVRKIAAASRALGYIPNTAAYSLRTTRTKIVGVVVPDITNSIFPPIIRGVEDALMEHGYATVLVNTDGGLEREAAMIEALAARGVDGLVIASVHRDDGRIRDLATQGTPVITVNRRMDDPTIPSVTSDEEDGVRRMLTHLAALGHKNICTIAGDQTISTGQRRHDAFMQIAPELGIEPDPANIVFASDFNESSGERCMEELLARGVEFTAVHCSNDRLAIGAISALRRRGLSCPADVSVTGFNDMPMVDRIDPPLTTIRIQQHKVGYVAAELLYEQMRELSSRPVPQHIVLPVDLVVRSSTAPPPAIANKTVRRAVKDRT